ncbi:Rrf2 family transcriptional regulator [Brumimicrobium glaciale]|jgi:Rrf2 family protein|uniref:Rrf2 family transcriptional regulator n=1 Tax=Brumimicrobium glaciale TaxID=200475 RepID=A0A4Q4KNQ8_9FLAO|nr:Rrf2 family transcriptional regulator [Brumimicrobium glaciale]RYM35045.1 Rrf2 family transcriptional regulator [Brumimicrobium glaciale]
MFSKACEYGIKATLYIAEQALKSDKKTGVKDISKAIDSPEAFTAKILQILTKKGIINSVKGPSGGFFIPKDRLELIKLSVIVKAIDGDQIYIGCGLGLNQCNEEKPCPVHNQFKKIRDDLADMLKNTSLLELATGLDSGLTFLKR